MVVIHVFFGPSVAQGEVLAVSFLDDNCSVRELTCLTVPRNENRYGQVGSIVYLDLTRITNGDQYPNWLQVKGRV